MLLCSWILRKWKDIFFSQQHQLGMETGRMKLKRGMKGTPFESTQENLENKQIEQETEMEMSSENKSVSIAAIIYLWERIMHTVIQYCTLRPP